MVEPLGVLQKNQKLLMERFPKMGFFTLHLEGNNAYHEKRGWLYPKEKESLQSWFSSLCLEKIDLLYVYGLGLGKEYRFLLSWLEEKKERKVVFLEDDRERLAPFLALKETTELLQNPRVYLEFIWEKGWRWVRELTERFPIGNMEVISSPSKMKKKRKLSDLRLYLLRHTTLSESIFLNSLYSHVHFRNFLLNSRKIPFSFFANGWKKVFKGVPAFICGAGPSLEKAIPLLKKVENRALIIAGGSSIAALSSQGVIPHLGVAVDPNREEFFRLKGNFSSEFPLLFSTRLLPEIFSLFNGPLGYMRAAIGGVQEIWMEEELGIIGELIGKQLSEEALSVTTSCLALAVYLGCDPIVFNGMDLSYTRSKRYAQGVIGEEGEEFSLEKVNQESVGERIVQKQGREKGSVFTTVKWTMEVKCIEAFARKNKSSTFINATEEGMGFSNIPYLSLKEVIEKRCVTSYDLRGRIHQQVEKNRFSISEEEMNTFLQEMEKSLERSKKHCLSLLDEIKEGKKDKEVIFPTALMVLAEMDLREEKAFIHLFYELEKQVEKYLNLQADKALLDEERKKSWEEEKWKTILASIEAHLACFSSKA